VESHQQDPSVEDPPHFPTQDLVLPPPPPLHWPQAEQASEQQSPLETHVESHQQDPSVEEPPHFPTQDLVLPPPPLQ
jgi:hypothetical protein